MNIIFILILLLIYILGTINIKKEYYISTPSELEITVCEDFSQFKNMSDIIIAKKDYENNEYFKHYNKIINLKNIHYDEYKYNYKYNERLYYYDFRWNLVTIFSFDNQEIPNNNWLMHNISKASTLYKIIYIHEDKANKYNKKIFPHLKYGITILIQGINPYHRYNVDNNIIISSREINSPLIKKKNTKNAYIKFYMDTHNISGIVKENNKIIDKFTISTNLDKIDYKKFSKEIEKNLKEIPPDLKIEGLPEPSNFFHKWHDPIFAKWCILFFDTINKKLEFDFDNYPIPTNYLFYLYYYNINYTEQYKFEFLINQFILDLKLTDYVKKRIKITPNFDNSYKDISKNNNPNNENINNQKINNINNINNI